jgi:hypothetical protein
MLERSCALAIAVAVAASIAAAGSASAGDALPLPAADQQRMDALLGKGVVGRALPSAPIDDPMHYFPLQEKAPSYTITSGKRAGQTQVLKVAKGQRPGGNPAWRFQLSDSLSAFLRSTVEGDLLMPAVTDAGEGVVVITTPANPFLLKGMAPGTTRSFTQKVSVNYLDDPTAQDYAGALTGTFTYLGTYEVTVPAGTFPAVVMRVACEGKVGPAHTQDMAYYLFSPGIGVVAMISQEDAEAFWVIHIDSSSGRVLAAME